MLKCCSKQRCFCVQMIQYEEVKCLMKEQTHNQWLLKNDWVVFLVGECILLCMYQISKYKQPSFATVLQRTLLYTYITTCFG
jgi:hypothetical protein